MSIIENPRQTLSDLDTQHDDLLRQLDDLDRQVLKALADNQPPPRPADSEH